MMAPRELALILLVMGCVSAAPAPAADESVKAETPGSTDQKDQDDLVTAGSAYTRGYSDWGGYNNAGYGASSYGVTGNGIVDDRYNYYGAGSGYDNGYYGSSGYPTGYSGYNNKGYGGYGNGGYGASGGYGGYGGYGGNGGLKSYYGNSNYYPGGNHLGYGYYSRPSSGFSGYGNIYRNGITPSLVTGYRGYSRR